MAVRDDVAAIARSNNQFAVDVYAKVAAEDGNTFLSPFSISTALAMVDVGAAGDTDQELRAALHATLPGERTHAAYGALLTSLDTGRDRGNYTLATADRLFGQQGFPFLQDFLATTGRDYHAELMPVDFASHTEAARSTVNAWVADQTDHQITELFKPGMIEPTTSLVLANAIVFKGAWLQKFEPVEGQTFHLANGTAVQATMMHRFGAIAMAAVPGGVLGILPFAGKDLSMIIVVPDQPDGLPAIEAQLGEDAIAQWIAGAQAPPEVVEIKLPRFGITSTLDLQGPLEALGIQHTFDPLTADFSALDGRRDMYLERIVHEAVIAVDEGGAEAAAATGGDVTPTAEGAGLVADRPFVFFIYDHVTGSILFMGRLADPTS